jgi:amino acid transporter
MASLLSPTFAMMGLIGWMLASIGFTFPGSGGLAETVLLAFGSFSLTLTLLAFVLVSITSPRILVYIPIAYVAWILDSVISTHAHMLELFRRPREWRKTERK